MNTLLRTLKRHPLLKKLAMISMLPLIYASFAFHRIKDFMTINWKPVLSIVCTVLIINLPIAVFVHTERTVPTFKGDTYSEAKLFVYENCHEMANNFIVAEDNRVLGYVRADKRNIDRIIAVIVEYEFDDSDKLIKWLLAFKNGDYSSAVSFHNYCWRKLGGEVGYAVGLKN